MPQHRQKIVVSGVRQCRVCGVTMPLDQFDWSGGPYNCQRWKCKSCQLRNRALWRRKRKAAGWISKRKRDYEADWRARKLVNARYPREVNAKKAVRKAYRRGRLLITDRCEKCGRFVTGRRLHKHHTNYGHPLLVIALCPACHSLIHNPRVWVDYGPAQLLQVRSADCGVRS